MDTIDKKIISILQQDARTPLKKIAAEVFLTSPAVSARIERLEAERILTGFHASVDPIQLGYHIKAYISLEISPAQKPEVYPFLRALAKCIILCYWRLLFLVRWNWMNLLGNCSTLGKLVRWSCFLRSLRIVWWFLNSWFVFILS